MTRWNLRLVVDPTKCEGRGVCAEMVPEQIELDEWGYPVFEAGGQVTPAAIEHAVRAVRACPRQALHLVEEQS
jgi:ferredoxin